jgi:signal transduction histidine kinase
VKAYGLVDNKRGKLKLIIEDTGVGMTRKQVANLFTNFTKIMDNRQLNKEGVGLGLTISRNIAQALGGDIEVQSVVGRGSNFILSLPLQT